METTTKAIKGPGHSFATHTILLVTSAVWSRDQLSPQRRYCCESSRQNPCMVGQPWTTSQKVGFSLWRSFNLRQKVLLFFPRNMQKCTPEGVVASKRCRHSHRWHISADYSGSIFRADTGLRPLFCPGLHSVVSWGFHILCSFIQQTLFEHLLCSRCH